MPMIMNDVMNRLTEAFRNFQPEILDFSDYEEFGSGKKMVVILVVTENFEHIRNMTRCRMLDDTLKQKDPDLAEAYTFAYECFTPLEYRMIRLCKNSLH